MEMIIDGMSLGRGRRMGSNKIHRVPRSDDLNLDLDITPISFVIKEMCTSVFNTVKITCMPFLDTVIEKTDDTKYEIKQLLNYGVFVHPYFENDMRIIIAMRDIKIDLSDMSCFNITCHINIYDLNDNNDISYSDILIYIGNNDVTLSYNETYTFLRDEEFTFVNYNKSYLEDGYNHPNIGFIYKLLGWATSYIERNNLK